MIMTGPITPSDVRERLHLEKSVLWFSKKIKVPCLQLFAAGHVFTVRDPPGEERQAGGLIGE